MFIKNELNLSEHLILLTLWIFTHVIFLNMNYISSGNNMLTSVDQ